MRLDEFWVVTNPTDVSELGDICFKTDADGFILQVKGGLDRERNPVIFTTAKSAKAYAMALLKARETYDDALMDAFNDAGDIRS